MGLVEDVDLEPVARRAIPRGLAQLADFIDAAVGSGINFDDVDGISSANLGARFAYATRFADRLVGRPAIQGHGQNACNGRFPDSAMTAEDVSVCRAPLLQGILQSMG